MSTGRPAPRSGEGGHLPRVAVIQPSLPGYRVQLFADVADQLAAAGVGLSVFHGDPPPATRARRDGADAAWAGRLPSRHVRLGSRELSIKRLPPDLGSYDLVIVEQAIRNLETYELLARSALSTRRLAFWGHGRTYTQPHRESRERLKQFLTRRGSWFFAYTAGGARHVVRHGFDADRVTVLNNTLDTRELSRAVAATGPADRARTAAEFGIDAAASCLFIGGLDDTKRLDFLLAAGERISRAAPGFALLVAGDGDRRGAIEDATGRYPWLRYVGRADAELKGRLAGVSQLLLMPGRVGLVAVDSFVLGTPIVTTHWPLHGPESEYLRPGVNAVFTRDDLGAYADGVTDLLRRPDRVAALRGGCAAAAAEYTLERMVRNFAGGVVAALSG